MADWHGYFVVERLNIGAGNWASLQALFEAMGTHDSPFPCFNNHRRARLDGDAVIYESKFDTEEVSIPAFKQLLADEFSVPVEDVLHTIGAEDYAGYGTTVWTFYYDEIVPGEDRFKVERFGGGGSWQESRAEGAGYLILYADQWEEEV
jgi:hypothetical protein